MSSDFVATQQGLGILQCNLVDSEPSVKTMKAFYSDHFVLPLPPGHRFPMQKYRRLRERLLNELPGVELCEAPAASGRRDHGRRAAAAPVEATEQLRRLLDDEQLGPDARVDDVPEARSPERRDPGGLDDGCRHRTTADVPQHWTGPRQKWAEEVQKETDAC